jgi:outer membrane protein W
MKRFALPILAFLAAAAAPVARAEAPSYQPIRVDLTFYGAYASADATSWGGGIAIEPKYNATDRLAVGFRFDAAGFVTQDVTLGSGTADASVSQGARAVTTFLAKADYYLTTSPARPFVGLGLGLYRIGAGSQSVAGGTVVQTAQAFRGFGLAPQVGVNFGAFRLAGTYHAVMGGDMVVATQAVGASAPTEVKLSKNFFSFELGGTFGGGRRF